MEEVEKKSEAENADTKKCPFCANTIKKDALKCEHCKEWVDGRPPATHSNARSMLQLWLMGVCSFGLYFYWWSYKNWVQIRDHKKIALGPGKRVIGMVVPLLGYYFTWLQFHDINESGPAGGNQGSCFRRYANTRNDHSEFRGLYLPEPGSQKAGVIPGSD